MNNEQVLKERLNLKLRDFSPDDEADKHWVDPNAGKPVKIKPESKPVPYIVFIIFVYLKKYSFGGKWEKVSWEIHIKYKKIPMMLAHKKFGFSIRTFTGENNHEKLAQEAIYKINKAIPVAEQLIDPFIKEQVDTGAVTLSNEYHHLRSRYEYFREQAEYYLSEKPEEEFDIHSFEDHMAAYNAMLKLQNKASNYTIAMIDAYYSLLEHILVMTKPFITIDEKESNLSAFIGLNWSDKYKYLYDISSGGIEKKWFDNLLFIKETYRNPFAHGNFQKGGASLYVHMPHLGAIPMLLTKSNSETHFLFSKFDEPQFNEVCDIFDGFYEFLKTGTAKYAMIYLESGNDVVFDTKTKQLYLNAMSSEEEFNHFVDHMERQFENARNMDW